MGYERGNQLCTRDMYVLCMTSECCTYNKQMGTYKQTVKFATFPYKLQTYLLIH